ncbi:MAG: hypothetical protein RLY97_1352, partial [Pseudomonadota bacterium]
QLFGLFDQLVKKQCDAADGVKDGMIQNPQACNFVAERNLPLCKPDSAAGSCFNQAQIEVLSVMTSGVTDERGRVIAPGYAVSEMAVDGGLMAQLTDPVHKIMVHSNDPAFNPASLFSFKRGGTGQVTAFHAVIPSAEVAKITAAIRMGAGHLTENQASLMHSKVKLLMWHNFSDEKLTPLSSINWYRQLAKSYGGYAKVQDQVRLFMIPATSHCSITGVGPNSFDALGALENWVEKGQAPDGMVLTVAARQFSPGAAKAVNLSTPNYAMPLCKFPEMARYSGKGDVQDAANWRCQAGDTRLLQLGQSGKQGGVM